MISMVLFCLLLPGNVDNQPRGEHDLEQHVSKTALLHRTLQQLLSDSRVVYQVVCNQKAAQHAASRYPLTASPETNCAKFKNKGRTIIGKIHKEILADFASAVLAWGVHGRTPPPASLRVSAAGRAKALGFPAADRPTAVRISSYTKNIIKVNMN